MASVGLESTVFAHGLPHPVGLKVGLELERIVEDQGAEPKTIGIIAGRPVVGLSRDQIELLATAEDVRKASARDLPVAVARGVHAATTVAATVLLAHAAGIKVVCTGGIGGVHRGTRFDVSNDLTVLGSTPSILVCSGAKAILDLPATREVLESSGVTVIGYQTHEMPAFYSRSSGLPVDVRCETPADVAEVVRARDFLGLRSTVLVCVPVPGESEIAAERLDAIIAESIRQAERDGVVGARLTPILLQSIADRTGGRSLDANIALLRNNAVVAAQIALIMG